jgi:hypothetical protein
MLRGKTNAGEELEIATVIMRPEAADQVAGALLDARISLAQALGMVAQDGEMQSSLGERGGYLT